MPSTERSPLLSRQSEEPRPGESSPLLADQQDQHSDQEQEQEQEQEQPRHDHDDSRRPHSSSRRASSARSGSETKRVCRWPSLIAMLILATLVLVVIILGFIVPPAIKQYVEDAVVLEPTSLSLESLTADGVRARIQADFRLDGSRVADPRVRRIGRLTTGLMRQLGTEETKVLVRLPHHDNVVLGSAVLPPLAVTLVDGTNNQLDFVADLVPGDAETMRAIVNQWLEGKLDQVKVTGATSVTLKSGVLPLGTHDVVESMVFQAKEIPSMPEYRIQKLVFHDVPYGDEGRVGVGANVSVTAHNAYPIGLDIPSLAFEVLVPNCNPSEPNIKVASAVTGIIQVRPRADVTAEAEGVIRELPKVLTRACPGTQLSPLDAFMKQYLNGEVAQVFVSAKGSEQPGIPKWIGGFIAGLTVPIDFPGRKFDNFLRNFSLADVEFKMPSPFADPKDPDGKPRVSGTVGVLAALPAELNVGIAVDSLRANADLIYKKQKFGELNLDKWQRANSRIVPDTGDGESIMAITSRVVDAPIDIKDSDVFGRLMQKLLFGDEDIILDVKSSVDVRIATALGKLVLRDVPAQGKVPVKRIPRDAISAMDPHIDDVRILNTSDTGVHLRATVNLTNPTPYTAAVPYLNIHIMKQGFAIGEVVARHLSFGKGANPGIDVRSTWDPVGFGGREGHLVSRRLLSDYLSGRNTTIELRAHRGTIPTMPTIGEALSEINVTIDTPRVKLPGGDEGEDGGQGFIRDATFHVLSSTASFTLASPLRHNIVHIERINATAFYNHTEPVGSIVHDEPFDAPPGLSQTTRLPVKWSASSVGFEKLKEALGGSLKLDAVADVTVRIGSWVEQLNYKGRGIGAKVSL